MSLKDRSPIGPTEQHFCSQLQLISPLRIDSLSDMMKRVDFNIRIQWNVSSPSEAVRPN